MPTEDQKFQTRWKTVAKAHEERKRLMAAWKLLNEAHTVLMADASTFPLAKQVTSIMSKLEALAERQGKKRGH